MANGIDTAEFWSKVDQTGECWIWTAWTNSNGQPWFRVGEKVFSATRLAYELTTGTTLPATQRARRVCRNRLCVRPEHIVARPQERFWASVDKTPACWNWTGTIDVGGYGEFSLLGVQHPAHRIAYEWAVGPTRGQHLDHVCRNRRCVNPQHLRLVTVKQNSENKSPWARRDNQSSRYRGVRRVGARWRATVTHFGKRVHAGYYASEEEAAEAVRLLRNKLFTHNEADRLPIGS